MSTVILDVTKLNTNSNGQGGIVRQNESSTERDSQAWNKVGSHRHSILSNNLPIIEDIDENATDSDWDDSDGETSAGEFSSKNSNVPNIDSVNIQNAQNTMFGNRAIYNGPVTIKQFVSPNEYDRKFEKSMHTKPTKGKINSCFKSDQSQQRKSKFFIHLRKLIEQWQSMNRKKKYITIAVVFSLFLTLILTLILVLATVDGENDSSPLFGSLRIVPRSGWNALPAKPDTSEMHLPSTKVIIAHTAGFEDNCSNETDCASRVLEIQKGHIFEFKYSDIAYNFLVGGDDAASIFVGRGWDIEGAHTRGHNSKSICIAFIGRFEKNPPPQHQLDAAKNLIKLGVHLKKLSADYQLYSQMQLRESLVPETALYEIIKKWEHWTEKKVLST